MFCIVIQDLHYQFKMDFQDIDVDYFILFVIRFFSKNLLWYGKQIFYEVRWLSKRMRAKVKRD